MDSVLCGQQLDHNVNKFIGCNMGELRTVVVGLKINQGGLAEVDLMTPNPCQL